MDKEIDFEDALKRLEDVVKVLEKGELTLKESIEKFEQGMELADVCSKRLDEAELKVNKIVEKDGKVSIEVIEK